MRLTLVRHAKSAWKDTTLEDHARPLNQRGRNDLPRMAAWAAAVGTRPDWAWISSAERTRLTAAGLCTPLAVAEHLQLIDERLYLAAAATLLDVLRETPADREWVMLVGHNPGVTELANSIAGTTVAEDLPTLAVVTFELRCEEWVDLRPGNGVVLSIMTPKRLPSSV